MATAFYTIRSGDVGLKSADPTKYIPGGTLNEIHIRVLDFRRKSGNTRRADNTVEEEMRWARQSSVR